MHRMFLVTCLLTTCLLNSANAGDLLAPAATDWPWWRGPTRDGVASANQQLPLEWDEEKSVRWKVVVPGRGHASPTVVGSRIYLTTADEDRQIQSVICYDRETGAKLWQTDVHEGGFVFSDREPNEKSSMASSTVACDGERLFVNFLNNERVLTTALDLNGEQLWQTKITDYVLHQGYGSSPAVYGSLVIVSADNKSGGALAAMDRETGEIVWKNQRPELPNYPSPIILPIAGRDQLILTGCDLVSGFEPSSGKKLWEIEGATTECVTSTVTDGSLIVTSGGYPENHISAVRADGSGEVVWKKNTRVYVPSMLVKDGYLYAVTDAGVATCFEFATGESTWKKRLGAEFTSSPVLVGDLIFITSDDGKTFTFKATPDQFEMVAENEIAGQVYATPTYCGSQIYMRIAKQTGGRRQEMLYCLAEGAR